MIYIINILSNLNVFDFLFNFIISSLNIMLSQTANTIGIITMVCFTYIIAHIIPIICFIIIMTVLVHYGIRELYQEFCTLIGATGATLAVGQNNPNNRLAEMMREHDENMRKLEIRQAEEREALLRQCKAEMQKTLDLQKAAANTK
jgi:hypothetical protein